MILHRCELGVWEMVGSEVIELEISKIPDPDKRTAVFYSKNKSSGR